MKLLKNIDLLSKLTFQEELKVIKTNHGFRGMQWVIKLK